MPRHVLAPWWRCAALAIALCAVAWPQEGHARRRPHRRAQPAPAAAEPPADAASADAASADADAKNYAARPAADVVPAPESASLVVSPPTEASAHRAPVAPPSGIGELFGRMHPALVHLPIGWLFALLLCELSALLFGQFRVRGAGPYLAVAACLSFLPAMGSGLLRAAHLSAPDLLADALFHRNVMISTFLVIVWATGLRLMHPNDIKGIWRSAYLALLSLAAMSIGIGAHMGSRMVYGDAYLPF